MKFHEIRKLKTSKNIFNVFRKGVRLHWKWLHTWSRTEILDRLLPLLSTTSQEEMLFGTECRRLYACYAWKRRYSVSTHIMVRKNAEILTEQSDDRNYAKRLVYGRLEGSLKIKETFSHRKGIVLCTSLYLKPCSGSARTRGVETPRYVRDVLEHY